MSIVYVTNVVVNRNPSGLNEPIELEVSFECLEPLEDDLEWKLVYVGSAEDKTLDQELDSIALGPIQRGALRFTFMADPPDYTKIQKEDIHGITVILLSGSYRHQEFVRVGWFVHNFFYEPQFYENPPDLDLMTAEEMIPQMRRFILADNPRVTRFSIVWDRPEDQGTSSSLFVSDHYLAFQPPSLDGGGPSSLLVDANASSSLGVSSAALPWSADTELLHIGLSTTSTTATRTLEQASLASDSFDTTMETDCTVATEMMMDVAKMATEMMMDVATE